MISSSVLSVPIAHQQNVFGELDSYSKKIEKAFSVEILIRGDELKMMGEPENVNKAQMVFESLLELSVRNDQITEQNVDYAIHLANENQTEALVEIDREVLCHTASGKPVKPKTLGQKKYVDELRKKMIVFGVGPAGTGKTYLAIAMAVAAFKSGEVDKIILTRPAIEAGEKLGFLPGDLQSKIDPYLRPLYDALFQIMGADSFNHHFEKGEIEVAPLAYMRGRTLDNAYIILDEAQNTMPSQMKMFLTRIGFNSRCIVTGDMTQKDLASGQTSGLELALRILKNIPEIGIVRLTNKDVVRHPLVQKIVEAYESYENNENKKRIRKNDHKH